MWEYSPNAFPSYEWAAPEGCQVAKYAMEMVTEMADSQDHVRRAEEKPEKTRDRWRLTPHPPECVESWQLLSKKMPMHMRVIGLDLKGRTVASSEVVRIDMNSPLGLASKLFNLRQDPNETEDLAKSHPDVVRRLEEEIEWFSRETERMVDEGAKYLRDRGVCSLPGQVMDEEDKEMLHAIGYLD